MTVSILPEPGVAILPMIRSQRTSLWCDDYTLWYEMGLLMVLILLVVVVADQFHDTKCLTQVSFQETTFAFAAEFRCQTEGLFYQLGEWLHQSFETPFGIQLPMMVWDQLAYPVCDASDMATLLAQSNEGLQAVQLEFVVSLVLAQPFQPVPSTKSNQKMVPLIVHSVSKASLFVEQTSEDNVQWIYFGWFFDPETWWYLQLLDAHGYVDICDHGGVGTTSVMWCKHTSLSWWVFEKQDHGTELRCKDQTRPSWCRQTLLAYEVVETWVIYLVAPSAYDDDVILEFETTPVLVQLVPNPSNDQRTIWSRHHEKGSHWGMTRLTKVCIQDYTTGCVDPCQWLYKTVPYDHQQYANHHPKEWIGMPSNLDFWIGSWEYYGDHRKLPEHQWTPSLHMVLDSTRHGILVHIDAQVAGISSFQLHQCKTVPSVQENLDHDHQPSG